MKNIFFASVIVCFLSVSGCNNTEQPNQTIDQTDTLKNTYTAFEKQIDGKKNQAIYSSE
jgi:outer membrane murein-binding lipoprotein Lpp